MTTTIKPRHPWFENTTIEYTPKVARKWIIHQDEKTRHEIKFDVESKDFNVEDFQHCFEFLSTERDFDGTTSVLGMEMLETKIPNGLKLYRFDTGMICTGVVEMLNTTKFQQTKNPIEQYEDLFNEIGSNYEYDIINIVGKQVNGYPDSVYITLKYLPEQHCLIYGYYR